jgi:NitT/TauT family transport system ATP-binding protein
VENVAFGLDSKPYSKESGLTACATSFNSLGWRDLKRYQPSSPARHVQARLHRPRPRLRSHGHSNVDEPFGPLDAQTRMILQDELLKIWEQKRQTIISSPTISSKPWR